MRSRKNPPASIKIGKYILTEIRDNERDEFPYQEIAKAGDLENDKGVQALLSSTYKGMFVSRKGLIKPKFDIYDNGREGFLEHLETIVVALDVGPERIRTSKANFEARSHIKEARFSARGRRF